LLKKKIGGTKNGNQCFVGEEIFGFGLANIQNQKKEQEIYAILKSTNLKFFCEVSFDLKTRFDFYIPLIDLVIEYDGLQHFGSLKAINKDIHKEELLKRLGIKLIRYAKHSDLSSQIKHDLIYHPVLNQTNSI